MRIGGVEVTSSEEVLVLPRTFGDDIIIRAVPVDMDGFEEAFPKPTVPKRVVKGGVEDDVDNTAYLDALSRWGDQRFQYLILTSLAPSKIEWETIDMQKPGTWKNWTKELQDAGFSSTECNRIVNCVLTANSLNEAKLRLAREAFLRGQGQERAKSSGQNTEQPSTQSGQPVSDSD